MTKYYFIQEIYTFHILAETEPENSRYVSISLALPQPKHKCEYFLNKIISRHRKPLLGVAIEGLSLGTVKGPGVKALFT